jgi:hypothetical protein
MKRYPKAFNEYWETVEYCGVNEEDDFKHEAYLAWRAGTKNGPIREERQDLRLGHGVRW